MKLRTWLPGCALCLPALAFAQSGATPLGEGSWTFGNFEENDVRVSVLARGLNQPFDAVFLPGTASSEHPSGDLLISETGSARVRHVKDGELLPQPVLDLGSETGVESLYALELHPDFADNGRVYFSWIKSAPHPDGSDALWATTVLSRARWDGSRLVDVEQLFEAEAWSRNVGGAYAPLQFLPDGTLLMGVSYRGDLEAAQQPDTHIGKILRLNDDGSVPRDNPYVAVEGTLPEIYSSGMRAIMDFVIHPQSGAVWELESGPQGGDEVNLLQPGLNYGWPLDSMGPDYDSQWASRLPWVEGTVRPEVAWQPSVTVSSMLFYTGTAFPDWQNNLFVSAMEMGRVPGTGHLQRVAFNELGETRRELLLTELKQRMRLVLQGPDGLLYLFTDATDAALLRMEPVQEEVSSAGDASDLNTLASFAASDCAACHRTDGVLVGPSYVAIAERYEVSPDNITLLMQKITEGGAGAWGEVPMNPHTDLDAATVRDMVERILALGE